MDLERGFGRVEIESSTARSFQCSMEESDSGDSEGSGSMLSR